jgi:hypothetical protein
MSTEVEKLDIIEDELQDQGTTQENIETELVDQGTTLDSIETNQTDGSQKTQIVNGSGSIIELDSVHNAIVTTETEHAKVHEELHYFIANFETLNEDANIDYTVQSPNTATRIHMTWKVDSTSQVEFRVYEAATVSDDGTLTTPINNDRNSSNTSAAIVRKNPTIGNVGTLFYAQSNGKAGSPATKADQVGVEKRSREIILKQNTKYLFRITSKDDGSVVSYSGEWYEV